MLKLLEIESVTISDMKNEGKRDHIKTARGRKYDY